MHSARLGFIQTDALNFIWHKHKCIEYFFTNFIKVFLQFIYVYAQSRRENIFEPFKV